MNHLDQFHKFVRHRNVALDDIAEFNELIEAITIGDQKGYKLRALESSDKIAARCQQLAFYTWHCRDHVKKVLKNVDPKCDVDQVVDGAAKHSKAAKVLAYIANDYKHCGTEHKQWADDIGPQLAEPFVLGHQTSSPHWLKPTILISGDKLPEFEFSGAAGTDDGTFQFDTFDWRYSCYIKDRVGNRIGDAVSFCEATFALWMRILRDAGFVIFPYFILFQKDMSPYMIEANGLKHLCVFSGATEMEAFYETLTEAGKNAMGEKLLVLKNASGMAKVLSENSPRLTACGCCHLAFNPTLSNSFKLAPISNFIDFLKKCA
jgi:hypothetical protein